MTPKQESWDLEQKGEVVVVPKETPWPEKKKKSVPGTQRPICPVTGSDWHLL